MQRAKLFAYVNNNIYIKCILQDKQFHLQLKSEQKEIIQNVLEKMIQWCVTHRLRKEDVLRYPPFLDKVRSYFLLMVICNSLLLLKSLPINVINCIKVYVNCSALTGNKHTCLFVYIQSSSMIHCGNRSFLEVT
jgi:hypothetical protein